MKFVRAIWKLLVGIKDALVLIFMLMFFGGLYGGLSARPTAVGDGVLDLNLNGSVVEQPSRAELVGRRRRQPARAISPARPRRGPRQARDDSRVKAVALDLDGFTGGGQTAIGDLADAVRASSLVGQAGHRLGDRLYQRRLSARLRGVRNLAEPARARCDRGPRRTDLYFKGLLDKLGVTANVYRVGTYKAAVEPFIRNDMSPEAKQKRRRSTRPSSKTGAKACSSRPAQGKGRPFLRTSMAPLRQRAATSPRRRSNGGLVDRLG